MTDRYQTNEDLPARAQTEPDTDQPSERSEQSERGKDIMHGRSFADANIANTEQQQTRDRQRIIDHQGENLDEFNELVTDAEIEARENNED